MSDLMKKFSLEGKVALVTGASYGIGFAIATAYAEAGATIVFNDIKQELVDKGLAAYAEKGIKAHGYVCDVTNEEAVNAMVAQIEAEVGVIDILVNNAGIIKRIPMHEMTLRQWEQGIDIDLNGPFICAKAVLPSMMERKSGKIINACSSIIEFVGKVIFVVLLIPQFEYMAVIFCEPAIWCVMAIQLVITFYTNSFIKEAK